MKDEIRPTIVAIIPARSGSKSIKDKNIMSIGGKPLIAHSIEHAQQAKLIDRTIVSTDSEYYAEIARSFGAEVPFIRPAEFAQDESTDLEVFTHALDFMQQVEGSVPDICVHLRPTCPIRDPETIDAMIRILLDNTEIDCVRSVSEALETPYKMWLLNDDGSIHPVAECGLKEAYNMPRQKLPKAYIQNASIDVVRSTTITHKRSMTGDRIHGFVMETFYDIDTHDQFADSSKALMTAAEALSGKTFCFDIDGVIATLTPENDYAKAHPIQDTIKVINKLYEMGNKIYLHTARGYVTGIDWSEITKSQMREWDVRHHELVFGKPGADYYVDDKMISLEDLKKKLRGL
jgi:CMP-N-acetylneuraminic acid synthetase